MAQPLIKPPGSGFEASLPGVRYRLSPSQASLIVAMAAILFVLFGSTVRAKELSSGIDATGMYEAHGHVLYVVIQPWDGDRRALERVARIRSMQMLVEDFRKRVASAHSGIPGDRLAGLPIDEQVLLGPLSARIVENRRSTGSGTSYRFVLAVPVASIDAAAREFVTGFFSPARIGRVLDAPGDHASVFGALGFPDLALSARRLSLAKKVNTVNVIATVTNPLEYRERYAALVASLSDTPAKLFESLDKWPGFGPAVEEGLRRSSEDPFEVLAWKSLRCSLSSSDFGEAYAAIMKESSPDGRGLPSPLDVVWRCLGYVRFESAYRADEPVDFRELRALFEAGTDLPRALDLAIQITATAPRNPEAWRYLSGAFAASGRGPDALLAARVALGLDFLSRDGIDLYLRRAESAQLHLGNPFLAMLRAALKRG